MAPFDPSSSNRVGGCLRAARCALAAVVLVVACGPEGATPIPQPPTSAFPLDRLAPPESDPSDPDHVLFSSQAGASGKLDPLPGSSVRVTDLDGVLPPAETDTDAFGNFSLNVAVALGDELRFEWLRNGERSPPSDARLVRAGAALSLEPSARFDCLTLTPGAFVAFTTTSATLSLHNGCAAALTLSAPRTRLGVPDFVLTTALPMQVSAGSDSRLDLTFTRSTPGPREDVLFVDVTLAGATPSTIRYPITLSAE